VRACVRALQNGFACGHVQHWKWHKALAVTPHWVKCKRLSVVLRGPLRERDRGPKQAPPQSGGRIGVQWKLGVRNGHSSMTT
jgi:hypothetical protein